MSSEEKTAIQELKRCMQDKETALQMIHDHKVTVDEKNRSNSDACLSKEVAKEIHIKNVLLAIRNVNHLIMTERDAKRLLKRTCLHLTESVGYNTAWIALLDASGKTVIDAVSSGFNDEFDLLENRLERGQYPVCIRQALESEKLIVIRDRFVECIDCPIGREYGGRAVMVHNLKFDQKNYGLLSVTLPSKYTQDIEVQDLFKGLADDLAFALYRIEVKARHNAAEKELVDTLESISDAFFALNEDMTVTYFNGAAERLLGKSAAEVVGLKLFDAFPEARGSIFEEKYRAAIETKRPDTFETFFDVFPYRNWYEVRVYPREKGISVYFLVTTERKSAEEKLRFQAHLLDAVEQAVVVTDAEGHVTYWNPFAENLYGWTAQDAMGRTTIELIAAEQSYQHGIEIMQQLQTGQRWSGEYLARHRSGHLIHVQSTITPIFSDNGMITHLIGISSDISEKIQAEKERVELERQFQQAQKLETIGRLAGGIAHDLNNLLSPILGYGEMLLEDLDLQDASKDPLQEIVNAGMRARDLVRQLLAFSRKQTLEFKPIDLNHLLKNFRKLLRRTIRENVTLHFRLADSLPLIKGDAGQLEQVVMNLAVNAQDAMADGGTLTIKTLEVQIDEDNIGKHQDMTPGHYAGLIFTDTGCGIDPETSTHLFEPFFTTKDKGKGTGLGLSTIYGIVKQHGGSIYVHSEKGLGSTFTVYLPVSMEFAGQTVHAVKRISAASGVETILLVEDNQQVRDLTLAMLKQKGYTVLTASGGKAALDLLAQSERPIHLLLTDVIMPEMDGKNLFLRVAALHPKVKVLYMSGYTDNVIAHHGVLDSGIQFIQKPFTARALAAKIRSVLDQENSRHLKRQK